MSTTNRPAEPLPDEATRPDPGRGPWWRTGLFAGSLLAAVIIGLGAWIVYGLDQTPGMTDDSMGGMAEMAAAAPRVPPVFGYYDGEEVFFIHTETSDADIAGVLEAMMSSPVPVVPGLAEAPDAALSTVYVFTNGVVPDEGSTGPLGFQADVFDTAPGDDDYSPLRRLVQVTWAEQGQARVLTSVTEIEQTAADGEVALEPTDVVINAPLLTWPGGQR